MTETEARADYSDGTSFQFQTSSPHVNQNEEVSPPRNGKASRKDGDPKRADDPSMNVDLEEKHDGKEVDDRKGDNSSDAPVEMCDEGGDRKSSGEMDGISLQKVSANQLKRDGEDGSSVPNAESHQDTGSPLFPMSTTAGASFNYLQDLKQRKMKTKKPSSNVLETDKLLTMIRQQTTKVRDNFPDDLGIQAPSFDDVDYDVDYSYLDTQSSGLPVFPGSMNDTVPTANHLNNSTMSTEANSFKYENHEDNSELFHCQLCPVAFSSEISLRGHMSSHKLQKKFVCPICSRSFAHSSTLNYHIRKHKGDLRYKCEFCDKRFLKPFRLKAHISCVHTGEKPFECSYCVKKFSCSINLTRHIRIHTGERPFLCLLCGKRFRDNSSFAMHRKYHSQNKPYECSICGKSFIKMHFLKTHQKCVHGTARNHECFICGKGFKVKDYLRKHLMTHQENKRYKCDFCEKSFPRIGSLKKHRYLHTGEEPFKCDICSKGFRDAYTLSKHKRLHNRNLEERKVFTEEGTDRKINLYECDKCERKFSLSGSLKIHKLKYCKGIKVVSSEAEPDLFCGDCGMLFHHKQSLAKHRRLTCPAINGKKDKTFLCSTCGLVFYSRVTLNDHLRTTTCSGKEVPENYKCKVCDAGFSHRATLSKHRKLHSTEDVEAVSMVSEDAKPATSTETSPRQFPLTDGDGRRLFECKHCGEKFRSKSALYDTHMRKCHGRPSQEKKNTCVTCGRKFHSKSDLRAHVRIHTGEKPFTCGVCGKSFTQRGHVSMHMKIHTGQRDFPCTICGKAFQFATTLRNHVKIHTGERPHVCSICGKGFIKYNNLKNHLNKHEKNGIKIEPKLDPDIAEQAMTMLSGNLIMKVAQEKKTPSGKLVAQAREATRKSTRSSRGSSMKLLIEEEMNPIDLLEEVKMEPIDYENDESGNIDSSQNPADFSYQASAYLNQLSTKIEDAANIDLNCPFCGYLSHTFYDLSEHLKTHTGSKPYVCPECGKTFVKPAHLSCHMQVHGNKVLNYRCLVCPERFSSSKQLQGHMKSHKGIKPFGCYFCDKSYGTSQHLRRHVKSIHPDKIDMDMSMICRPNVSGEMPVNERRVHHCRFCDKSYMQNQHMLRHMRKCHPELMAANPDDAPEDPMKTETDWDPESAEGVEDSDMEEEDHSTPPSLNSSHDNEATDDHDDDRGESSSQNDKSESNIFLPQNLRKPIESNDGSDSDASTIIDESNYSDSKRENEESAFIEEIKKEPEEYSE